MLVVSVTWLVLSYYSITWKLVQIYDRSSENLRICIVPEINTQICGRVPPRQGIDKVKACIRCALSQYQSNQMIIILNFNSTSSACCGAHSGSHQPKNQSDWKIWMGPTLYKIWGPTGYPSPSSLADKLNGYTLKREKCTIDPTVQSVHISIKNWDWKPSRNLCRDPNRWLIRWAPQGGANRNFGVSLKISA